MEDHPMELGLTVIGQLCILALTSNAAALTLVDRYLSSKKAFQAEP